LEVHVDDTAGEDACHVRAKDRLHFCKLSWLDSVATVLSKEGWNRVVAEFGDTLIKARLCKGRITAPRVDIVSPEINSLILVTAVEVICQVLPDDGIVVGSISNIHLPVVLGLDVRLHVANGSLHESTGICIGLVVGDLVTGEETDDIAVGCEAVDDTGITIVELVVPCRRVSVNR
jgi:hypothetical protein